MREKYFPDLPTTIREVIAYSEAATFIITIDGSIVNCNEIAVRIFGFDSVKDICRVKAMDLTPEDFGSFFPVEITEEHLTNHHYLPRVNMRKNKQIFASEVLTYKLPHYRNGYIAVYVREEEDYAELDENLRHRCMQQNMDVLRCELVKERRLRAQMVTEKVPENDFALFSSYLSAQYPKITNNDLKISMMLIRNLDSSDIAERLSITKEGVFAARKRLRKKLKLTRENDLVVFLQRKFGEVLRKK